MKTRNRYKKGFIILPCWLLFLFTSSLATAQTTNISGIVNTYHRVVEVIPAKACIRVASVAGLNLNTKVLLVQMKGATINTSNNSSFGTVTSLNEAGNYETGTICSIIGDSVFLFHNLLNTYSPAAGKVQLVQFAEYYSANVTDTIKAASWNNTTGTGGVIAIYTDQDITLNAPVYADSAGFRGGNFLQSNGTCSDVVPANGYIYTGSNTSPQNGAYKGEGITDLTSGQTGGRGAPANGGGGGNNHNNSGGGGANLTAGGIGGGNSSNGVACTVTLRGEAGKALSSGTGLKIYSGGGGGAGHSNNGLSNVSGGNGGGIIFIWTNELNGNNRTISANGGRGGNSLSDGAGGGGGGGTIIMHVTNYTGAVTIEANGGNGGNSDDGGNIGRCFGGGGGGSGGAIYFTAALPAITTNINGGAAGVESSRDASCDPVPQAAGDGINGLITSNYTFSRSMDPAGYCAFLLSSGLIYFSAAVIDKKVLLKWKTVNPLPIQSFEVEKRIGTNNWVSLLTVNRADTISEYVATDSHPDQGYNYYRLRINNVNNSVVYSSIRQVYITPTKNTFTVYPNPAVDKISVTGNFRKPSVLLLYDISGKLVLEKRLVNNSTSITLPALSPGIYILQVNETIQKLFIL
ncbi:MAG: T9SS type A sorting domain-containing protein [Chitinophagaceae bacterium]|nr:T9SS type A sorting domain-containing protein [Chitinophagaceae bacterium]